MNLLKSTSILSDLLSLHPKIIDLTLDRVTSLLNKLNNPEKELPPVIHIAGTNGKGSTQALIRSGLEGFGKSVHAYTSPHLSKFHERIVLSGDLITEKDLIKTLKECQVINANIPITFFEITTCAAFLAFSRIPADYTLLEVGLGGRLDATNVIENPELTIITPISLDHIQFLGDTITSIAKEKAGIIKKGIPCIVGPQTQQALSVIRMVSNDLGSPLKVYNENWHVKKEKNNLVYQDEFGKLVLPLPSLIGDHQVMNAGTAIAAMRELKLSKKAIEYGLRNVSWPARMQRLKQGPLVEIANDFELWLDGGHNEAAGKAISSTLNLLPDKQNILICGMLKTKDIVGFLKPFRGAIKSVCGIPVPGEDCTSSPKNIADLAVSVGIASFSAQNVQGAIKKIQKKYSKGRIIICGSLYLAGNILKNNS